MLHTRDAPLVSSLHLAPEVGLARGRAHEVTGAARVTFALWAGAAGSGAVLWLHPAWASERLMGDGVQALAHPGRFLFGRAGSAQDMLWAAEEALRSGRVPLVVAELPQVPGLTPVRRLQLAASAGAERAGADRAGQGMAPLVLLLTPGAGGAPGVETRWRVDPAPGWAVDGQAAWRLARLRARMAPEAAWTVRMQRGRLRTERAGAPC